MPLTGGAVGVEYFEFKVPEPGGGKPIPVRLCGSVQGLLVVVRSATAWQSIHSAPRRDFHAERSVGQPCSAWATTRATSMTQRFMHRGLREDSDESLPRPSRN